MSEVANGREAEALEEKLKEKELEIEGLRQALIRLQADFDNYRKRVEREMRDLEERLRDREVLDFLVIYDSLERALDSLDADGNTEGFVEGVRKILGQFREILERKGCRPFNSVGERFDPAYHEAVLAEESDAERNTILAELERGWMRNGRLLRPAKVVVSLGPKGGDGDG